MEDQKTLFITGAAGYVGAMLCDQFSKRPDVREIIALDKEPFPEFLKGNKKITYLEANTSDTAWIEKVKSKNPEIVIHTAWQIRELYGNRALEWKWNVEGSSRIFDFTFSTPSVKKIIYFSTVASYGAFPENTTDHFFTEEESFRESEYLYAEEKRVVEEMLHEKYVTNGVSGTVPQVFVVRPAAITGPRGRNDRIRFGLQASLSGSLMKEKSLWYKLISLWVSWVPVTPKWLRQYIHEDDVTDIVELLSFNRLQGSYEVFNIAPPGDVVFGKDMAKAVGKRMIPILPWMVRISFFVIWHLSQGRIPCAPGSWKGYSYPIAVDGSKLTKQYGYRYKYESKEAFVKEEGRYK